MLLLLKGRISLLYCLLFGLFAFGSPTTVISQTNKRLEIPQIRLLEKKKNRFEIQYQLVNTGSTDIELGKSSSQEIEIIYTKDTLFGKDFDWEAFLAFLLSEKRLLKTGESIKRNISWKVENKPILQQMNCPDLIISEAQIVRENKSYIWLEYTLENVGQEAAYLLGKDTINDLDNIVVKCSVSANSKPDRAEWNITESILGKSFKYQKGAILPGQKIKELIKIHLDGVTKFTPYIIFSIDPYSMLNECNRRNNYFSYKLNFDGK